MISNTDAMATPAIIVEPYDMTYDTTVPVTYNSIYQIINIVSMTVHSLNADEETTAVTTSQSVITQVYSPSLYQSVAVTILTTVFNCCTGDNDFDLYFDTVFDTPSLVYNDNDNYSFGRTITTVSFADEAKFSDVMMKSYDQYNLYFDTTFDTTSNTAFSATKAITSTSHLR